MVEGKSDWAVKITQKLQASLMPGERVTVVRLSPAKGNSDELWHGCWPDYSPQDMETKNKESHFFTANPVEGLKEQKKFFLNQLGNYMAAIYKGGKRPEIEAEIDAAKAPEKQILRALASDEGRFSSSQSMIRAIVYSDMMENSDLGSVFKPLPEPMPNYAEKLGSHLSRSVFYIFGVANDVVGSKSVQETAKSFWMHTLSGMKTTVGGFGSDLNVPNNKPIAMHQFDLHIRFDNQDLDGKMVLLVDANGDLVDSTIGFSRLSISRLTGTFLCRRQGKDECQLEGVVTPGLVVNEPTDTAVLSGNETSMKGKIGASGTVDGTKGMFDFEAEKSRVN